MLAAADKTALCRCRGKRHRVPGLVLVADAAIVLPPRACLGTAGETGTVCCPHSRTIATARRSPVWIFGRRNDE